MTEPDITVNGVKLTLGQAMTVRVALGSFAMDLQNHGLGDDEVGKGMKQGYLNAISAIVALMSRNET